MLVIFRPHDRSLQCAPALRLLAAEDETFEVRLLDKESSPITLVDGDALTFAAKAAGQRDASLLTIDTDCEQDPDTKLINLTLNAWTDTVQALAKLANNNLTDDVIELECDFSLTYTPIATGKARQSFRGALVIEVPVALPTDGTPAAVHQATFRVSDDGNFLNFYVSGVLVGAVPRVI